MTFQLDNSSATDSSIKINTYLKYTSYRDLNADNWVIMTGAHDLNRPSEINRKYHRISRVFVHPGFDPATFDSDIALLKLDYPLDWLALF